MANSSRLHLLFFSFIIATASWTVTTSRWESRHEAAMAIAKALDALRTWTGAVRKSYALWTGRMLWRVRAHARLLANRIIVAPVCSINRRLVHRRITREFLKELALRRIAMHTTTLRVLLLVPMLTILSFYVLDNYNCHGRIVILWKFL